LKLGEISIVGTGYVGLCTAVGFAHKGFKVITSTHQKENADLINKGQPPFYELGLDKLLKEAIKNGRLRCVTERKEAVLNTDITFICVATSSREDGSIDLQHINNAAQEIGEALRSKNQYHLVVVKSTVTPGTTQDVVLPIIEKYSEKRCGVGFGLCMNPEFLREGSALHDTFYPDRVIIGEYDKESGDVLEKLYRKFHKGQKTPILRSNLSTAEIVKYASNAFLATKISFINTIANICEKIPSVDVTVVAKAMGLDKRISPAFLSAGLGYGGSCFPKDIKALIAFSEQLNYDPKLLKATANVNENQPYKAIELIKKFIKNVKGKKIAVLGLSFKPNTDDIREASSLKIIRELLEEEAVVKVYDPKAMPNVKRVLKDKIEYASSPLECIKDSDCCILVTEWDEFKKLDADYYVKHMRTPIVVDGRRIYDPREFIGRLKLASIGLGEYDHKKT